LFLKQSLIRLSRLADDNATNNSLERLLGALINISFKNWHQMRCICFTINIKKNPVNDETKKDFLTHRDGLFLPTYSIHQQLYYSGLVKSILVINFICVFFYKIIEFMVYIVYSQIQSDRVAK